jgi:hypothetical protein
MDDPEAQVRMAHSARDDPSIALDWLTRASESHKFDFPSKCELLKTKVKFEKPDEAHTYAKQLVADLREAQTTKGTQPELLAEQWKKVGEEYKNLGDSANDRMCLEEANKLRALAKNCYAKDGDMGLKERVCAREGPG